jgi:acid phosphatase family membrane protein YuiD
MVAGAAMVAGSLLPWIMVTAPLVGTITRSGTASGDGWLSVVFGAVVICGGYLVRRRGGGRAESVRQSALIWLPGLGGVVLATVDGMDIGHRIAVAHAETNLIATSYGLGLPMMGLGALVAVICGALLVPAAYGSPTTRTRSPRSATSSPRRS